MRQLDAEVVQRCPRRSVLAKPSIRARNRIDQPQWFYSSLAEVTVV